MPQLVGGWAGGQCDCEQKWEWEQEWDSELESRRQKEQLVMLSCSKNTVADMVWLLLKLVVV